MAIASCLTPTDPIICSTIVGESGPPVTNTRRIYTTPSGGRFAKEHVPLNLRRILSAESAANDGLAYPFLSISLYLTLEASRRTAIGKWFLVGWLCTCIFNHVTSLLKTLSKDQVILGTILGAVLGESMPEAGTHPLNNLAQALYSLTL